MASFSKAFIPEMLFVTSFHLQATESTYFLLDLAATVTSAQHFWPSYSGKYLFCCYVAHVLQCFHTFYLYSAKPSYFC